MITKADLLRRVAKLNGEIDATAEAARKLEGLHGQHPDADYLRQKVLPQFFREVNALKQRLAAMEPVQIRITDGGYDLEVGEYFADIQPGRVA
jgi:hypothetical protein